MTNREMMEIAMRQSAEDMGCRVEDLKADKNVVVPINLGKKARKYLKEPITCNLVSYGNNIMAASIPETMDLVSAYVEGFPLIILNKGQLSVSFYFTLILLPQDTQSP